MIGSWKRRSQQTNIPALVPTVSQLWQGSTTKDVITPSRQTRNHDWRNLSDPRIKQYRNYPSLACLRCELTNQNLAGRKKLSCPDVTWSWKGTAAGQCFSLKTALNIHEQEWIIPTSMSDCKKWKLWNILCLQALIWRQYVPCQIKPRILVLFITKGQSN